MTTQSRSIEDWVCLLLEQAIIDNNDCWLCHLLPNAQGYSCIAIGGRFGRKLRASRFIYSEVIGQIPDGMLILHSCDNPRCINPDHLFLGTEKDNTQDMINKGRHKYEISRFPKRDQDRQLLMEFYERGFTMMEIARCLNVSNGTVFNYVSPKGAYYVSTDAA